jgi:hypothetical protein
MLSVLLNGRLSRITQSTKVAARDGYEQRQQLNL